MQPLAQVQSYIGNGVVVCACVALAVLMVVQFIKPWFRDRLQHQLISDWQDVGDLPWLELIDRPNPEPAGEWASEDGSPLWLAVVLRERNVQYPVQHCIRMAACALNAEDDPPKFRRRPREQASAGGAMSNALRMRLLQDEAQAWLEAPLDNLRLFTALTRGAPDHDRLAAVYLDALRRIDATLLAHLSELREDSGHDRTRVQPGPAQREVALAIAGVRANLSAAADRNLNGLQLNLRGAWSIRVRALALVCGAMAALLLGCGARVVVPGFAWAVAIPTAVGMSAVAGAWRKPERRWRAHPMFLLAANQAVRSTSMLLAFGIGWGVAVMFEQVGWIGRSVGASDLLAAGLIGGAVAPVAFDTVTGLLAGRR